MASITGISSSRAAAFTGEGSSFFPRLRTASGRLSTKTTSKREASSRRDGTAKSGVPMNTTRIRALLSSYYSVSPGLAPRARAS